MPSAYPTGNYLYNEGDAQLPGDAMLYFILALVGVGIVTVIMLVNPWAAILLMCAVGLVDLYLFGKRPLLIMQAACVLLLLAIIYDSLT